MSIDSCKSCGAYVDTDFDPDCYVAIIEHTREKPKWICLCETCRDEWEREQEAKERQQGTAGAGAEARE